MLNIVETENRCAVGVYAKRNLVITRGQGALLYDESGRAYIDCVGGQGTANIGHAHPRVTAALAEQAARLIALPEMFYNDQRAALLDKVCGLVPGLTRAFLCNSGAEAIEAALKFAMASAGRRKVVAAVRGFHGRTLGALSATWNKKYREPYEPLLSGFSHTPYNDLDKLAAAVNDQTAAVILEVVQGEGGVHLGAPEFLRGAQALCRERGALLIVDEVQTGWGRTGRMFAFQHHGLQPDLVCAAKSMAGGLPMGVVLLGERVRQMEPGLHGSTFGGNPLACAAALAAIGVIEDERLAENAAEQGAYLMARLRALNLPAVREVRGLGLLVGIEIRQKVAPYLQALTARGVLALSAGLNVLRLLPPLVITREQVDAVVDMMDEVLR